MSTEINADAVFGKIREDRITRARAAKNPDVFIETLINISVYYHETENEPSQLLLAKELISAAQRAQNPENKFSGFKEAAAVVSSLASPTTYWMALRQEEERTGDKLVPHYTGYEQSGPGWGWRLDKLRKDLPRHPFNEARSIQLIALEGMLENLSACREPRRHLEIALQILLNAELKTPLFEKAKTICQARASRNPDSDEARYVQWIVQSAAEYGQKEEAELDSPSRKNGSFLSRLLRRPAAEA